MLRDHGEKFRLDEVSVNLHAVVTLQQHEVECCGIFEDVEMLAWDEWNR